MHASTLALTLALAAVSASASPLRITGVPARVASARDVNLPVVGISTDLQGFKFGPGIKIGRDVTNLPVGLPPALTDFLNRLNGNIIARDFELSARGVGQDIENIAGDAVNFLPTILKFSEFLKREEDALAARGVGQDIEKVAGDAVSFLPTILKFAKFLKREEDALAARGIGQDMEDVAGDAVSFLPTVLKFAKFLRRGDIGQDIDSILGASFLPTILKFASFFRREDADLLASMATRKINELE